MQHKLVKAKQARGRPKKRSRKKRGVHEPHLERLILGSSHERVRGGTPIHRRDFVVVRLEGDCRAGNGRNKQHKSPWIQ